MHRAQVVIRTVAGKSREHLDPHPPEEIHHHFLVTLDVVFAHIVNNVIAGYHRLNGAHLLVNPGNIDFVMPT